MPPLSDQDIERYARQIVIPGIGAAGQERLIRTRVLVCGRPDGAEVARRYLETAGLQICESGEQETADAVLLADPGPDCDMASLPASLPVAWYRLQGTTIRSGVAPGAAAALAAAGEAAPEETEQHPECQILHAVAACDGAATIIALTLGWIEAGSGGSCEVDLG